ncbi:MAG TPA: hypothetical protein VGX70_05390, partial [Gemmataceae bacterium]|nr:hypothetical protein [Gemmataceae bacterium]
GGFGGDTLPGDHWPGATHPEDVAKEYGLPVHAVLEAIDYCLHHQELLDADRPHADISLSVRKPSARGKMAPVAKMGDSHD